MKNNIKRFTAMTAALVMCLSLISCGQNDNSASDGDRAAKSRTVSGSVSDGTSVAAAPKMFDKTDSPEMLYGRDEIGYSADADVRGITAEKSAVKIDAVGGEGAASGETAAKDGTVDTPAEPEPDDKLPDNNAQAFVLTAGEWNDNNNWGFFTNLIKSGTIKYPVFGFDPSCRIAVTVTKEGAPAKDQPVELVDIEGNVIWSARSDKKGMAYVFYKKDQTPAKVISGEASQDVVGRSNDEQGRAGTTEAALEVSDSRKLDETQVMFILDTTGSMDDEIAYLQMDFSAIAKDVDDGHTSFSVNFYRDIGDDYVTKCNPFTTDVSSVQSAINQEQADGGDDYPEAVAQILEETITNNDQWSDSANKIAFLIFDAPPHDGKEQQLEAAVKTAARKGIHLVPVVSSGADRSTELFARAIAVQTGSNYIFLTDDSGVGGSHLEPIIGEHKVELLHDIIVRNITELRS